MSRASILGVTGVSRPVTAGTCGVRRGACRKLRPSIIDMLSNTSDGQEHMCLCWKELCLWWKVHGVVPSPASFMDKDTKRKRRRELGRHDLSDLEMAL